MAGPNWADLPLVGPMWGDNSEQKGAKAKIAGMQRAGNDYAAYRDINARQRLNSMDSLAGMFQPANNALGQMYGPGAQIDLSRMSRDPRVPQNYNHPSEGVPAPVQMGPDGQPRRAPTRLNSTPVEQQFIKDPNYNPGDLWGNGPSPFGGPNLGPGYNGAAPAGYMLNPKYVAPRGNPGPHNHGGGIEGFGKWIADPLDLFPT